MKLSRIGIKVTYALNQIPDDVAIIEATSSDGYRLQLSFSDGTLRPLAMLYR